MQLSMQRARWLALFIAYFVLVGGGPVRAAETGAGGPSSQPKTSGPVELSDSQCSGQAVRSDSGTLLGQAQVCLYLYDFDNLSELDVLRDHGAGWLQARFAPAPGWCATEVGADMQFSGGRMESISKTTAKGRKATARLNLTAGDNALEDAKISQTWKPNGGPAHAVTDGGPAISIDWSGSSAKAITLTGGLGYSYEILQGAPEKISYGFSKFSLATC